MLEVPRFRDSDGEETLFPEEYAAQWGCDPKYDRAPRLPGDGYLFYNFGSERQERTPEWLQRFVDAIGRTIEGVRQRPNDYDEEDEADLEDLKEYVEGLLQEAIQAGAKS